MHLLLYSTGIALLGLFGLFFYQFLELRSGKVDRLPNITLHDLSRPALQFAIDWYAQVRQRIAFFSYPILLILYRATLRLLHTLTSRIAQRFNHLADTIKGKGIAPVSAGSVSAHWQEYKKL